MIRHKELRRLKTLVVIREICQALFGGGRLGGGWAFGHCEDTLHSQVRFAVLGQCKACICCGALALHVVFRRQLLHNAEMELAKKKNHKHRSSCVSLFLLLLPAGRVNFRFSYQTSPK